MLSSRLLAVASLVDQNAKVADIGCDHGLLGIYLKKNNLVDDIVLSDISPKALNNALNNLKRNNLKIKAIVSDGLKNIDTTHLDTLVISGMGTKTILEILDNPCKLKNINNLIISSNNNLDILRKKITQMGYYIVDEITVLENKIWYVIIKFKKGQKIKFVSNKYGLLKKDKALYYQYRLKVNKKILKKLSYKNMLKIIQLNWENMVLLLLLKKCRRISN